MTRTYLLRTPSGQTCVASFRVPREKRPGFAAEWRALCARVLLDWSLHGFTVVRRLPPRRVGRNPRAIPIV